MLDHFHRNAEAKILKLLDKQVAVDKVDRLSTITRGFSSRVSRKAACGDDEALICSPDHCAAEVAHCFRTDISFVALALKENIKADETSDANRTVTIDSTIA